MMKFVRCVGILVTAAAAAGCGGGDDTGSNGTYVRADVTLTGGAEARLDGPCVSGVQGDVLAIERIESSPTIGISITWSGSSITGPGTYSHDLLGDLQIWVVREHPTEAGTVRVSNADAGTVTFTELASGTIEGTFDGVVLVRNEPDDTVDIRIDSGTFVCLAP